MKIRFPIDKISNNKYFNILIFVIISYIVLSSIYSILSIEENIQLADNIFFINKMFVIFLFIVFLIRIIYLSLPKQTSMPGGKFYLRTVIMVLLIGGIPAMTSLLFIQAILRIGSDDLTKNYVTEADEVSRGIANYYFDNEAMNLGSLIERNIKPKILNAFDINITPTTAPIAFNLLLKNELIEQNLLSIILLDEKLNIVTSIQSPNLIENINLPEKNILSSLYEEKPSGFHFTMNDVDTLRIFTATMIFEEFYGGFIIIHKAIPENISSQLKAVRNLRDRNIKLLDDWDLIEKIFSNAFFDISFSIIFLSIWFAFSFTRFIVPLLGKLIEATNKIAAGKLKVNIEAKKADGDFYALAQNFNAMSNRLYIQNKKILDAAKIDNERRKYIELILSGVSSGVVAIDENGKILEANKKALELLKIKRNLFLNNKLVDLFPQFKPIYQDKKENIQIEIEKLNIRFDVRRIWQKTGKSKNMIITFDDITPIIYAQRIIAWREVAKSVAHEIKNPLTPIQLSAEWVKRFFARNEQISKNDDENKKVNIALDIIIERVGDINRMVSSFYKFADMPVPKFERENLGHIIKHLVEEISLINKNIVFEFDRIEDIYINCDKRLIDNAFLNIIQNSINAFSSSQSKEENLLIKINIIISNEIRLEFIDNGPGIPKSILKKVSEPYVTTKGTGLGLAITKKIITEHGGKIFFENLVKNGAKVIIIFPMVNK